MLELLLNQIDKVDQYIAIVVILITLAEAITNLTPTEKDNSVVMKIKSWFDILVPNRAKVKGPESETVSALHKVGSKLITKIKERRNARRNS